MRPTCTQSLLSSIIISEIPIWNTNWEQNSPSYTKWTDSHMLWNKHDSFRILITEPNLLHVCGGKPRGFCGYLKPRKIIHSNYLLCINASNAQGTFSQSTRKQRFFLNSCQPCDVGIHWRALAKYSQMSTHVPVILQFFCIILYWPN